MGCRIYVAGASAQIEVIEDYLVLLRKSGFTVTHDWTAVVRNAGAASPDDAELRKKCAREDLRGVLNAEIIWLIQPENSSTGAWVELGYALGLRDAEERDRPLIIVSGESKRCIFSDLADQRFVFHEEAFEYLVKLNTHGWSWSDFTSRTERGG